MTEFPKNYDFFNSELKWQKFWEENRIYESKPDPSRPKFSVVIPPPNVTGVLHFGHILNNTIQDIYCRRKRMQGFEVCWVPGMDHAGIATQVMVEKELAKSGKNKYDLGRDKFIELTWQWKEKNGGTILRQLRKLGASVDWSKERFTLDEGLSLNVRRVFVDLYKKGLIYRGNRIVNWDPASQTAVSDDEISYEERNDKLYYIKYRLEESDEYITIATTRPETMFGDTAVAVNPEDSRYSGFKNKRVKLPFLNKLIPVIFDDYVDKEFGTGALKITPAHDINDFEVGQRHNLEAVIVLSKDSRLNELTGEFNGLDITEARKRIVDRLKEQDLLVKTEDLTHNVAISDRTKAVIEPYLSEQWFVSMKQLAGPALEVVRSGKIKFYPDRFTKVYYHWMENIRDWCISRQLWWGHQIPIWYHKTTGEIYCEVESPSDPENWTQDEDVLDTWFSSWLWPLSVFGWENSDKDKSNEVLKYYYPTDLLSTAPDIIFLWVARMIMAGMEYMKEIPFSDVYFHSTIRDGKGVKLSKTLGNYSDSIEVMDKYGTDALRFTMVILAPLGNDVFFDEDKTQIGRNFVTKLWNAGRFLMMMKEKIESADTKQEKNYKEDLIDEWIESRFNSALDEADKYLKAYRLNDYAKTLHSFVWSDFCDWYIELIKIKVNNNPEHAVRIIEKALRYYDSILKILHPVIPYVTEELWHLTEAGREGKSISLEQVDIQEIKKINSESESKFEKVKEIVTAIRNLRTVNNIVPSFKSEVIVVTEKKNAKILNDFNSYIKSLCNLDKLEYSDKIDSDKEFASTVISVYEIYLSMENSVNKEVQSEKINKEIDNLSKYLDGLDRKLSNENFLSKASADVIEKEKQKQTEAREKLVKLQKLV
ncbi:MAG TPA: valine--tRNA ligase [Ignavibacteria bacterium]|nr:valine--tRNA ligase [Ignavibacteria bacterium]